MPVLIYFTRELPGLTNELQRAGFQVYEALALSEALTLAEQHPTALIVIDASVEDAAAYEVALRHATARLTPGATAAELAMEITEPGTVQ